MASLEAQQLDAHLRSLNEQTVGDGPPDVEALRAGADQMAGLATPVEGVEVTEVDANGCTAVMHLPEKASEDRVVMWTHGGGYNLGSARTHERMISHLALAAGCRILNLDFRRAPEHPYPAAHHDALKAFQWLVDDGHDPATIAVGGDSAGGGLALSTLLALRDSGRHAGAGVLISPWTDLSLSTPAVRQRAHRDTLISVPTMHVMAANYLAGHDPRDPVVSPLFADLAGLPPLYIAVSEEEVLYDDSALVAERAGEAGTEVELDARDGLPHVYTLWAGNLPEADETIARIGAWLHRTLSSEAALTP
jgi:monoterpene epsilon-lactone hydrolase